MLKTYEINLDIEKVLYQPTNILFNVSRNDFESIELQFDITQDEAAFDLTGTTVELAIKKPSGLVVYQAVEITDALAGKAAARLSVQAYVEYGVHTAEIYVRNGTQLAITSPFYFMSREAIMDTAEIESINDWSALQQALFAKDDKPILIDGLPTSVPDYVGQMAFDITGKRAFIANDLLADSWQLIAAGDGGGGIVYWADILNKPATFPPDIHTHLWADITDKPTTFPPENHMHNIAAVDGLQLALDGKADDTHSHTFAEITEKPATYPAEAHTHAAADITDFGTAVAANIPAEYLTETEAADVYDRKPSTGTTDPTGAPLYVGQIYINTTSKEAWIANSITGDWQTISQDDLGGAGTVAWNDVTEKPLTFTPSAHTHPAADITDFGTAVAGAIPPEYLTETEGDARYQASGTVATHNHQIADVVDLQAGLDAKQPKPTIVTAAPTTAPTHAGQIAVDTTNKNTYVAEGTTAADWQRLADEDDLTGKADAAHSHTFEEITAKPATYPPEAHTHLWAEITDKPATFTPSAHTHAAADITDFGTAVAANIPAEYLTQTEGDARYQASGTVAAHTHTEADLTFGAKNAKTYVDDADNFILNTRMGGLTLWKGTQTEYDAIATKDPNTLYFIV